MKIHQDTKPRKLNCSDIFNLNLADRVKDCFYNSSYDGKDLPETAWRLHETCRAWDDRDDTVKSPIEEILYSHILFCCDGFNNVIPLSFPEEMHNFETWVSPQYKVGKYTADFVFCCRFKGEESRLLVECDGHDFHEKTKEQAINDKKRDRYFTSQGYKILRFTGSEIYNSAENCAEEITNILSDMMNGFVTPYLKSGGR